ncbi:hypothetical protein EKO27_g11121 [Xylaria grammica]|uniref:precorrin-2 dehydrogenase n=1 Tax=Xylaria grammica TaxID=363999 RepID=A0A439CPA6_9PEZI|nr:hypothetical protein EKO27_g11121 [Xylaria grammica]
MANTNQQKFPDVQGGGSLILAWQIKNKTVLVVGGGEVAAGRILNVLNADANVIVIVSSSLPISRRSLPPTLLPTWSSSPSTTRPPLPRSGKLCKEHHIPANIADVPSECDFYFGSVHRDGPLQIMVSTNGKGPRLAASIRKWIGNQLPAGVGNAIERIGELRVKLRKIVPDPADGPRRMRWMTKVSDAYSWDDMCALTDEDMDNLLIFYPSGKAPELQVLKAMRGGKVPEDLDVFDGSFGFSIGA